MDIKGHWLLLAHGLIDQDKRDCALVVWQDKAPDQRDDKALMTFQLF